jgi:hypothetical protein
MLILTSDVRQKLRAEISVCESERYIYGKHLKQGNITLFFLLILTFRS